MHVSRVVAVAVGAVLVLATMVTFTQPVLRDGTASAFAWLPHVPDSARAAWERRTGLRIIVTDATGHAVPAPRRSSYDVVRLLQTTPAKRVALGFDSASSPVRRETLMTAARLGEPQATPVIQLAGADVPGIVVYAAVRGGDGRLAGTTAGTFRVTSLISSMAGVLPAGSAFELRQSGRWIGGNGRLGERPTSWTVNVGGQNWVVLTAPAPAGHLSTGVIALLVGGLLTALVLRGLSHLAREAGRAQRIASQNEERFAQAFDHAPVGMALLDGTGRHVRVNDAMAELLGREHEDVVGSGPEDIMPADDAEACRRLVAALLRGDQASFRGDTTLLTGDGRQIRAAVHMSLLARTAVGEAPILVHAIDVTGRRLAESRMRHLADHDPLTGLLNRRGFGAAMRTQVACARRYGAAGALLILDLDGFKGVNDTLGHEAGDRVLLQVSGELRACLRETDVLARLGGDEFAVILPRESLEEAAVVAAKITERLRGAAIGAGPGVPGVTASIGVAPFTADASSGEDVIRAADLAMYSAKAAGRDRHAVHGGRPGLV